jgi:hypothetical protein
MRGYGACRVQQRVPFGTDIVFGGWRILITVKLLKNGIMKNEKTHNPVASKASKLLNDPKTPKTVRSVAASALTQAPDKKKKAAAKPAHPSYKW